MNRTILITGASRGIGAAAAELFAANGANVVIGCRTGREQAMEIRRRCGNNSIVVEGDVGVAGVPEQYVQEALSRFGSIDVLINNAGVTVEGPTAIIEDVEIARMIDTNINGVIRMSRAVLRPMVKQKQGCIINLSSVLARRAGRGNAVYAGTRAFVEAFTRSLAMEVGKKGIRVNAVAPGVIETDMTRAVRSIAEDQIVQSIASRRIGSAEEVARVLMFVASDSASYINGAVVPVDGGFN